jgi:hypothetical protein
VRTLLITSPEEDYLQDSIIHGFKKLFARDAIDYPAKDILYDDYTDLKRIRGNGFTLYGLLAAALKHDAAINIEESIRKKEFELIVFTSIYRQYEIFYKHVQALIKSNTRVWIMDGEDSPVIFPYLGKHIKKFFNAIKPHKHFTYFKRELSQESLNSMYLRLPLQAVGKKSFPKNIKPIAFSIPEEKIIRQSPAKQKLFVSHIIDDEVAEKVYGYQRPKLFDTEDDYYKDLRESKFGITTKRAGWDCLRHYEIAANGTVICFKDLQDKPASCAPHGLINGENCIAYTDYVDLKYKTEKLSDTEYSMLQQNGLTWVKANSTINRVQQLLSNYQANDNHG